MLYSIVYWKLVDTTAQYNVASLQEIPEWILLSVDNHGFVCVHWGTSDLSVIRCIAGLLHGNSAQN